MAKKQAEKRSKTEESNMEGDNSFSLHNDANVDLELEQQCKNILEKLNGNTSGYRQNRYVTHIFLQACISQHARLITPMLVSTTLISASYLQILFTIYQSL